MKKFKFCTVRGPRGARRGEAQRAASSRPCRPATRAARKATTVSRAPFPHKDRPMWAGSSTHASGGMKGKMSRLTRPGCRGAKGFKVACRQVCGYSGAENHDGDDPAAERPNYELADTLKLKADGSFFAYYADWEADTGTCRSRSRASTPPSRRSSRAGPRRAPFCDRRRAVRRRVSRPHGLRGSRGRRAVGRLRGVLTRVADRFPGAIELGDVLAEFFFRSSASL